MTDLVDRFPSLLSETYDMVRRIEHSGSAVVYEVISSRGRLRGRYLAVKRVIPPQHPAESVSVHQTLSHPNVTALHSVVSSFDFDYHILELCSEGNLFDLLSSRNPPTLSGRETRQIVRDIGSALAYLKEERIIHRNICTSNIILAKGFKGKICDFKHAIQLRQGDAPVSKRFTFATHPAPEMLRLPYEYSFTVDAWAFGCVILSCLDVTLVDTNLGLFDGNRLPLLVRHSLDLQDLIVSLLVADATRRLDVERILKHRYLMYECSAPDLDHRSAVEGQERHNVLMDVSNMKIREFISSKSTNSRQLVADSTQNCTLYLSENKDGSANTALTQTTQNSGPKSSKSPLITIQPIANCQISRMQSGRLPMGTTRPVVFDTQFLTATTHKLASGSITILPSLSVLVDFRESQRRHGFKGDRVLLIDPTGRTIKIFGAPHLSVPSCLVEPIHLFSIDDLPSTYWKQYNDAANFIYKIKQKTPQMTVYKSGAKCTLMSNLPSPDIEIVLHAGTSSKSKSRSSTTRPKDYIPIMRIHYSRRSHFLEFAEHFFGTRGPEWKKECKPCSDLESLLAFNDLSETARKGLHLLSEFLQTCLRLEWPKETTSPRVDINLPVTQHPPLSLSSVKIPLRPQKYPNTSVAFQKKVHPRSVPELSAPPNTLAPPIPTGSLHDIFSDTRYIHLVGWCVRRPAQETSRKMKYQIMFIDGGCLEVDFHNNGITFLPSNENVIRCPISAKSSFPELEKCMHFLKDFMLLYEDSETTATTSV